jgi:hypothetical protein
MHGGYDLRKAPRVIGTFRSRDRFETPPELVEIVAELRDLSWASTEVNERLLDHQFDAVALQVDGEADLIDVGVHLLALLGEHPRGVESL